jgi:hypothetical protein
LRLVKRDGSARKARHSNGESGAAMIEAAFMLFFLSFFLMFLLYGYTLFETMTRTLEDLRYQWREKSEKAADNEFKAVKVEKNAIMQVSGVIGDKLSENPVQVPLFLKGYAGSYTGTGKNKFAKHTSDRTIKTE